MRSPSIPKGTYTARRWTDNEDYELIEGLRAGLPCRRVADNLNEMAGQKQRTTAAVQKRAAKYGGIQVIRNGREAQSNISAVRSALQVSRLLGMPYHVVKRLCRLKILKNSRTGYTQPKRRGKNWHHFITDDALMTFLDDRAYWMLIDTALIVDTDWRAYAELAREGIDGEWIAATVLAAQLGYASDEGRRWIRRGHLPGVKVLECWYVWSGDVQVQAFVQSKTAMR